MDALSSADILTIKIHRLEREVMQRDARIAALTCRLTELLHKPTVVLIERGEDDVSHKRWFRC